MVTEAVSPVSSLRAYRPLLITLLLTLFVLLLVETGVVSRERGIETLQARAATHLDRYVLSLQQKLDRYKDLPRLLSTHSDLTRALLPDRGVDALQQANRYLEQVNEIMGTTDVYLMNPQGMTVAASNWRSEQTFIGRNFSFRPYFQAAMAGREGRYFALGTTSKRRGYYFSYPLRLQGQQQVLGVVVVKVDLHDVERHWSNPQIDLLVTDPDGVIFISTRPEWKFRALQPLPQEDMERILASLRYGDYELSALEVLKREPLAGGGQLITLLDSRPQDRDSQGKPEPRQLLLQHKTVQGFGLSVSVLGQPGPGPTADDEYPAAGGIQRCRGGPAGAFSACPAADHPGARPFSAPGDAGAGGERVPGAGDHRQHPGGADHAGCQWGDRIDQPHRRAAVRLFS